MLVVKLDKIIFMIPYTYSKIELRTRNILINNRKLMDSISHFMQFYLTNHQYQVNMMKHYTEHLKDIEQQQYDSKFQVKSPTGLSGRNRSRYILMRNNQANVASQQMGNYTTNYSSNMPPVASGSQLIQASESVINVPQENSALANSNPGLTTIEK